MPRMIHRADRSPFAGKFYAHRGIHDNHSMNPENSLAAFLLALEKGYGIELDVQLTKDHVLVVFHDHTLHRACGSKEKVSNLTYEELKKYPLFQSKQVIPTLEDVLKLVNGKVPLIIELKVEWDATKTCEKLNRIMKSYHGHYCIQSFSPLALIWYKKNRPEILRGQLSTDFLKEKENGNKKINFLLQNLLFNFLAKPDFIAYNYKYGNKLSLVICRKLYGALTFAWTIQSEESLQRSETSFDRFIFDSFLPKLM